MTDSSNFSNFKDLVDTLEDAGILLTGSGNDIQTVLWKILIRTPLGKVFNDLASQYIDVRLLIQEGDDDTFECGRFAYITESNMIKLFETNSSSISYGLGDEDSIHMLESSPGIYSYRFGSKNKIYSEMPYSQASFFSEKNCMKLEKLIINSLKRHKINCTKTSSTGAYFEWDESGMFGSEVGFTLDVDFKSFFSESEIKLMSNHINGLRDEGLYLND